MRALCVVVLLAIGAGCIAFKPARVLVPESFGLRCFEDSICVESPARMTQARALFSGALAFVENRLGPIETPPPALFCSSSECFSQFADPRVAAVNVGTYGVVINARGWQPYILRHELIHHWQNERFGRINASALLPRWYIEGMAYELS